MHKILVTGGAGFIGSHLVERLVSNTSNQVVVLDNLRRGRMSNLSAFDGRIEFVQGDIRDRDTVQRVMQNIHTVYHLAAQSNVLGAVADLDYSFSTNVIGTFEILRAASAQGVERLVFASSREVYGDSAHLPVPENAPLKPKNAYGASKAAGEMYCRTLNSSSFQTRILRLANVYGVRDFDRVIPIFLRQALQGKPLTLFGGKQILDFIWIDHVVEALIRAAQAPSLANPVNIGSGKGTELPALAQRIINVIGSRSELHIAPTREVEVARFVADVRLQKETLGLESPADPLSNLDQVAQALKAAEENSYSLT